MIIKEAINTAAKFASTRTGHAVLACIASRNGVITASDLQNFVEIKVTPRTPNFVVPAKILKDTIKGLEKFEITAESVQGITITHKRGKQELNGYDLDDYPETPKAQGEKFYIWESRLFTAFTAVNPVVEKNHSSRLLRGINLKSDGLKMTLSAADNYKAARRGFSVPDGTPTLNITIPLTWFSLLKAKSDREICIYVDHANIVMEIGDIRITSRLIEGEYPNFPDAPNNGSIISAENRVAMIRNLEIAKAMGSEKVELSLKGNKLIMSAFTTQIDRVSYEIAIRNPSDLYYFAPAIISEIYMYTSLSYYAEHPKSSYLRWDIQTPEYINNAMEFCTPAVVQSEQSQICGIVELIATLKCCDKDRDVSIDLSKMIAIGSVGKEPTILMAHLKNAIA
jgi:DNA polymerase-3 subunit beta